MTTCVYLDHDGGGLHYRQFDSVEEANEWVQDVDYKVLVIDGINHEVFDHT